MKVKPLKDRVLIKPKEAEEKTAGGIYIPDTAREKTVEATVVAAGTAEDMPVKEGDRIIYDAYAGTELDVDGQKHLIVQLKDIMAVIE